MYRERSISIGIDTIFFPYLYHFFFFLFMLLFFFLFYLCISILTR